MGYEIVTDSSADLTDELIEEYGIHIVSLSFRVGGRNSPLCKGRRPTTSSSTTG